MKLVLIPTEYLMLWCNCLKFSAISVSSFQFGSSLVWLQAIKFVVFHGTCLINISCEFRCFQHKLNFYGFCEELVFAVRRTFIASLRLCKSRVAPKLLILEIISGLPNERSLNNADDVKWMKAREQISSNEKQTLWASQTTPWHSEGQSSKKRKAFSPTTLGISVSSLFRHFSRQRKVLCFYFALSKILLFAKQKERCRKKETKKSFVENIFHCWNVLCRHLHLRDEERERKPGGENKIGMILRHLLLVFLFGQTM